MRINGQAGNGVHDRSSAQLRHQMPLRTKAGEHLSALQLAMQATGMVTRFEPLHAGPPRLVVTNPEDRHMQEIIYAAPRSTDAPHQGWCFWWAWGDPICPVERVEEAARRIAIMLRP